jgi:hypothetical protein
VHTVEGPGGTTSRCERWPSFSIPGDGRPRFCRAHAPPGAEYKKARLCEVQGCSAQPSFGDAAKGRMQRCRRHALPSQVDLRAARCSAPGCSTAPSFFLHPARTSAGSSEAGARGDGAAAGGVARRGARGFCAVHRPAGAQRPPVLRCRQAGCSVVPTFGLLGGASSSTAGRAESCSTHRSPGDVDVVNVRCSAPSCARCAILPLGAAFAAHLPESG